MKSVYLQEKSRQQNVTSPVIPRLHDTTGCQPVWQPCWTNRLFVQFRSTRLSNRLYNAVWQPRWTNSCSFNTVVYLERCHGDGLQAVIPEIDVNSESWWQLGWYNMLQPFSWHYTTYSTYFQQINNKSTTQWMLPFSVQLRSAKIYQQTKLSENTYGSLTNTFSAFFRSSNRSAGMISTRHFDQY